jgi:hypothetical protein
MDAHLLFAASKREKTVTSKYENARARLSLSAYGKTHTVSSYLRPFSVCF